MSGPTTGAEGFEHSLQLRRAEDQRRANEEAEIARLTHDLTTQRCQTDYGITDQSIIFEIAREILSVEAQDRRQVAARNIHTRELTRLGGDSTVSSSPPDPRVEEARGNVIRATEELSNNRAIREETLRRFINLRIIESTRIDGRRRAFEVGTVISQSRGQGSTSGPVGFTIEYAPECFMTIGQANDYLTLHNPSYPRGDSTPDLAARFRNIKMKGNSVTIRALKNAHKDAYAWMMEAPSQCLYRKCEPELMRSDCSLKNQPVLARIRDLAADSGHGRGYALAVQGSGDNGEFYGIASYNCISSVSPNQFFNSEHLGDENCRMVDFNFQLVHGKLPVRAAVEAGTLLIEHARRWFGAQLFRSECSPLNSEYIAVMDALGLERFRALEPASYNSNLAAATWKFDLSAWKATAEELARHGHWFIDVGSMQEIPGQIAMVTEPEDRFPNMARLSTSPTYLEDPAAYADPLPALASSSQPGQDSQASGSMEWTNSTSYITGTASTLETGTSSGLGHSESEQSQSTQSTFARSHAGSSASSSREISRVFRVQGKQVAATEEANPRTVWQGSQAMRTLRMQEASRAIQQPGSSDGSNLVSQRRLLPMPDPTTDSPESAGEAMQIDSPRPTMGDHKGKRRASSSRLGQPGPSRQVMPPTQAPHHHNEEATASTDWPPQSDLFMDVDEEPEQPDLDDPKGKRPATATRRGKPRLISDAAPPDQISSPQTGQPSDSVGRLRQNYPGFDPTLDTGACHDRSCKRPASESWDTQPKRQSRFGEATATQGDVHDSRTSSSSVNYSQTTLHNSNVTQEGISPSATRFNSSESNRQISSSVHLASQQAPNLSEISSPSIDSFGSTPFGSQMRPGDQGHPPLVGPNNSAPFNPPPHSQMDIDGLASSITSPQRNAAYPNQAPQSATEIGLAISDQQPRQPMSYSSSSLVSAPPMADRSWRENAVEPQIPTEHITPQVAASISQQHFLQPLPVRPGSPQAPSSEASRATCPATLRRAAEQPVTGDVQDTLRLSHQMRTHVSTPSSGVEVEHRQGQGSAETTEAKPPQSNTASHSFIRQPNSEYYNLAQYNYVEFVEEQPPERAHPARSLSALPVERASSSSAIVDPPKQRGFYGSGTAAPSERHIASNTVVRQAEKQQQQQSFDGSQEPPTLGNRQTTESKEVKNNNFLQPEAVQQHSSRIKSTTSSQVGPSRSASTLPQPARRKGKKMQPSNIACASQTNPAHPNTAASTSLNSESFPSSLSHSAELNEVARQGSSSAPDPSTRDSTAPWQRPHEQASAQQTDLQECSAKKHTHHGASPQQFSQHQTPPRPPQHPTPQQTPPLQPAPQQPAQGQYTLEQAAPHQFTPPPAPQQYTQQPIQHRFIPQQTASQQANPQQTAPPNYTYHQFSPHHFTARQFAPRQFAPQQLALRNAESSQSTQNIQSTEGSQNTQSIQSTATPDKTNQVEGNRDGRWRPWQL